MPDPAAVARGAPGRHTPEPFPPYRHRPGETPHPVRHPQGHSHAPVEEGELQGEVRGRFLRGVDLYNHGYWWEAHEAWEEAWILAGRRGERARLLQGLIQVAASHLKLAMGRERGARKLLVKARRHLEAARPSVWNAMGLSRGDFLERLDLWWPRPAGSRRAPRQIADFPYLRPASSAAAGDGGEPDW